MGGSPAIAPSLDDLDRHSTPTLPQHLEGLLEVYCTVEINDIGLEQVSESLLKNMGKGSEWPLTRWGLVSPIEEGMYQIACTFAGYHAVRRHFKTNSEVFLPLQENISGPQIRAAWTVFAETFHVEASQFSMPCRKFSVPSFLVYLNGTPDCVSGCIADQVMAPST